MLIADAFYSIGQIYEYGLFRERCFELKTSVIQERNIIRDAEEGPA
jgi:hypothetical protein